MSAITELISKLKKIESTVVNIAVEEVKTIDLAQLNREQLINRKDANDKGMPKYVRGSKAPSAPSGITLFDTGDYHGGIEPLFDNSGITMTSTDRKVSFLDPKYPTALGLAPSSLDKIRPQIIDGIIIKLRAS